MSYLFNSRELVTTETEEKAIARPAHSGGNSSPVIGYKIPAAKLDKICNEIDRATVVIMDAETIGTDLDNGLVSHALASKARLYPAGQVEIAAKEHADRLARIAIAQTEGAAAARGIVDKDPEGKKGAVEEKAKIRSQE